MRALPLMTSPKDLACRYLDWWVEANVTPRASLFYRDAITGSRRKTPGYWCIRSRCMKRESELLVTIGKSMDGSLTISMLRRTAWLNCMLPRQDRVKSALRNFFTKGTKLKL